MDIGTMTSSIWAQIVPAGTAGTTASPAPTGTVEMLSLSLRRWYASLTLSSPDNASGLAWLWPFVAGLAALILLVFVLQGPKRALRQLLDFPGLFRLQSAAIARLKRSGRLIAVVVGITVLSWSMSQTLTYNNPQGREDLIVLLRGRPLPAIAIEHGVLAGCTPLRDIVGMGNMDLMLIAAAVLVFQYSSDRWGSVTRVISPRGSRDAAWGTACWGAAALYAVYRIVALLYGSFDVPVGNCAGIEALLLPILMVLADGLLLAWVCVEVRNAILPERPENDRLDLNGVVGLIPAASLVCLLMFPARYLATAAELVAPYTLPLTPNHWISQCVAWILGWGVIQTQAAALLAIGLVGGLTWSRGTLSNLFVCYARLLKAEGGHMLGALVFGCTVAAGLATAAYGMLLSSPTQPWVLAAADSYSHYATLPVGLMMIAALVELGERSLPLAAPACEPAVEEVTLVESRLA